MISKIYIKVGRPTQWMKIIAIAVSFLKQQYDQQEKHYQLQCPNASSNLQCLPLDTEPFPTI